MAALATKTFLATGALGLTSASGFGIYKGFLEPSTIKDKVLSAHKGVSYSFLKLGDSNWKSIQDEYAKQGAIDKPVKNGKEVTKEDLPAWCQEAINSYFHEGETSKFNSVLRWCYVNLNSFEAQATALNKVLLGQKTNDTETWKTAWNAYKPYVGDSKWKITDSSADTNLNGAEEGKGATALQTWCSSKSTIHMYENGAKDAFLKFEKFCLKDKVN
ncbi:hypothetical protein HF1_06390 [Mycoplasma haemofelis str. Langford 1]|uniref:Uncharacterized protein n=2 Tax=Mycoplasma haemofelis TaxID=29501 RepID=F6FIB3_MYCHI|nr:hypothetical protein [Mycoplasma haemofelis]AEG72961.1 hypothetical protein MHF_0691 [Mycoplasma haemofelis Ohio2]CBY92647.1 hypothetical protein HF1_06390 [Mycoplasma haemofelis str. Langford 1]